MLHLILQFSTEVSIIENLVPPKLGVNNVNNQQTVRKGGSSHVPKAPTCNLSFKDLSDYSPRNVFYRAIAYNRKSLVYHP